jgi:glycosyltransferase involved in cell wall biosynthesis
MSDVNYTVVVPAYNAASTLAAALASARAQTVPPTRMIVVDDGSTDDTISVATAEGAEVIQQHRQGPGTACNKAVEVVTTPFVAFLDADDLWLPEKVEAQLKEFDHNPELSGVFGWVRLFLDGRDVDPAGPTRENWGRTTLFLRTERFRQVGPIYDPIGGGRGDMVDWIARGRELGLLFQMQTSVVAFRRISAGSMSYGRDARDVGYLDVARRALERKRRLRDQTRKPD